MLELAFLIQNNKDKALIPTCCLADIGFGFAVKEDAVRENVGDLAGALEGAEEMEQEGLIAIFLRRQAIGDTVVEVVLVIEALDQALV